MWSLAKRRPWLLAVSLLAALLGCSGRGAVVLPQTRQEPAPFIPPTAVPFTPAASPGSTPSPEPPRPTPPCTNNLVYLSDLTIPDGSIVAPGEQLDKRWEVENDGTCNWDDRYRLRLIAGPSLGASTELAINPARSGAKAVLRILFNAPTEPGAYRSAWQAYAPDGEAFGDPFYVDFAVQGSGETAP